MLPERINAIKTVTYHVPAVVETLRDTWGVEDITLEAVVRYIEDWLYEDFGDSYGVILQDENGNEL